MTLFTKNTTATTAPVSEAAVLRGQINRAQDTGEYALDGIREVYDELVYAAEQSESAAEDAEVKIIELDAIQRAARAQAVGFRDQAGKIADTFGLGGTVDE